MQFYNVVVNADSDGDTEDRQGEDLYVFHRDFVEHIHGERSQEQFW